MHATERKNAILSLLNKNSGFISFQKLEKQVDASPATIRRDLGQLVKDGLIERVRGGAKLRDAGKRLGTGDDGAHLLGSPFDKNVHLMRDEKEAIGRTAAGLCQRDTSVMIDGGSTTLAMCDHLVGLDLQVFTNSLHIVSSLLQQGETKILVPGGSVFREQNIILSAVGDEAMPRFHAPQLYMGASSIGPEGVMQPDIILVASERRLIERSKELIVLVDNSKFHQTSGNVVCDLSDIDIVITDEGVRPADVRMLEAAGTRVIIAGSDD